MNVRKYFAPPFDMFFIGPHTSEWIKSNFFEARGLLVALNGSRFCLPRIHASQDILGPGILIFSSLQTALPDIIFFIFLMPGCLKCLCQSRESMSVTSFAVSTDFPSFSLCSAVLALFALSSIGL